MTPADPHAECPRCGKALDLCVCDAIQPLSTRTHVLVLQHPQEPDVELGSARVLHLSLPRSTLRVGLSWPNLKAALGREFTGPPSEIVPSRWVVLHLGSGMKGEPPPRAAAGPQLVLLDKKGAPLPDQRQPIDGLILLDGTWSQAKTLWWRNAWLLKCRRAVLVPAHPSLYRELRREPRRECLSTIESAAEALVAVGEAAEAGEALRALFARMLDRARARRQAERRR